MDAGRSGSPDCRSFPGRRLFAAFFLCSIPPLASAEPFIGQFELKNLESKPGLIEFQSQNAWSWRQPARRFVNGPDGLELDENSVVRQRHALEVEFGFTRAVKMRVGVEFEKERLEEPGSLDESNDFDSLELSEVGAEIIAVLAPREGDGAGFGLVAEIEGPVDGEEPTNLVLGPIFEYQRGRWFAAVIPMVIYAFGGEAEEGERVDTKWDFAYAAQLTYTFNETWSLALEGYGTIERLGNTGHPSESARIFGDFDQHRLGPVLYCSRPLGGSRARAATRSSSLSSDEAEEGATLTIGIGLLEGLNGNTPDHTLKLSIEVDF